MPRCEDFPCCGHEPGDCPTADGRFRCVECGKLLPKNATSSMHPRCAMRYLEQADDYYQEREDY